MSGRIGDRKTFGSGWVLSLALPFGPMMLTTGLLVILRTPGDEQNELKLGTQEMLRSSYRYRISDERCAKSRDAVIEAPNHVFCANQNQHQPELHSACTSGSNF